MPTSDSIRKKYLRSDIVVTGKVQVVGFRDNVRDIAVDNNVFGEVRNMSNYDVRIVCEGTRKNILHFEQDLENLKRSSQKRRIITSLKKKLIKTQEKIGEYRKKRSKKSREILFKLRKQELKLNKGIKLQKLPQPEISDIKPTHTQISKITFPGFIIARDVGEQGERLDFGAQQLVKLQEETIDNINFNLMDMNFERMDFKYDNISKSINTLITTQNDVMKSMKQDRKEMKQLVRNINSLVTTAVRAVRIRRGRGSAANLFQTITSPK